MGAVPSANYYESDIDLYPVNGVISDKLAQRHSYYENNKSNNINSNSTSKIAQRLKSSVPNISYSHSKKEPIKKPTKINRFFTFRQKCEDKYFLKSKSTHNFLSKSSSSSITNGQNGRGVENDENVVDQIESSSDPSKNLMDESLGLVTSRSGSMSLLSSSYSIKSRISTHLNKASTPNEAIEMDKCLIGKDVESTSKINSNNTSCSSGCSSAASSSNLSRNSRLSHSNRQQDSPLSSISTGYQSSSCNKHQERKSGKGISCNCKNSNESRGNSNSKNQDNIKGKNYFRKEIL